MDLERLRMADHASALLNAYVAATSRRHAPDQFLSIRFVEVERGTVRGRLDQYWDPERHSAATTEFVGHVGDDVIEATFTTTSRSGNPSTGGHWKVRRTRR